MNKFEPVIKECRKNEGEVILPLRGTKTSAGYDFYTTENLLIRPQTKVKFFTDVKVKLDPDKWLLCVMRSSMGVKNDLMLCNTIGVIDSDYYGNEDNDGNIGFFIKNTKPEMKLEGHIIVSVDNGERHIKVPVIEDLLERNTIVIPKGERIVQGIIVPFDQAINCNNDKERVGGFGSTKNK